MPVFYYKAFTKTGSAVEGILEAGAMRDVLINLRRKNLKILHVEEKRPSVSERISFIFQKKVSTKDIMRFTNMFATLVKAGIPLSSCLRTLEEQSTHPVLKKVLNNVLQDIESGADLSAALSRHPNVFNRMYVDLIRAGESSGALSNILERLAIYTEKSERLRRKIKGAMVYPSVVMGIAVIIVWIIIAFVVPEFADTFAQAGKQLPLVTRILLRISDLLRNYLVVIVGAGILLYSGFKFALRNDDFKRRFDYFILQLPLIGEFIMKSSVSRFSRTLAMLQISGIPIIQALEIVSAVTGNVRITEALLMITNSITSGESFAEPLKRTGMFEPLVVQMVTVGESTGNLAEMLNKIADFYEEEVDSVVQTISTLIEPFIIVFLGVILGFVIIALFMPILSLSELVNV